MYIYLSYVIAIRIMYSPIDYLNDLNEAEEIIKQYLISLEDTFGIFAYTFTAHANLHLAEKVLLLLVFFKSDSLWYTF